MLRVVSCAKYVYICRDNVMYSYDDGYMVIKNGFLFFSAVLHCP